MYQHGILYTTVHLKRGNICQTSSMLKSRPLQFGFSEEEAEMEFGVQAFTGISSHARRKKERKKERLRHSASPAKPQGDPGVPR